MDKSRTIRNFALIAHIDHGKSTLADRLIEQSIAFDKRQSREQMLDSMDIERERGITVKTQTVRLPVVVRGDSYIFNVMDTPGHVDFSYEVSRALASCEGAFLIVDATQGIEAQTLANAWLALENDLDIVPVLNKCDLPSADTDKVADQLQRTLGFGKDASINISAKTGFGMALLLESAVERFSPPRQSEDDVNLKALLVDSWYDAYLGVVILVRVYAGALKKGQKIRLLAGKTDATVERVGVFLPHPTPVDALGCGEIGFITTGIKSLAQTQTGDTIVEVAHPDVVPLSGFRALQPVVFCGLFPDSAENFPALRDAIAKLSLNDSSFSRENESSPVLGLGFRCGFLGLLHLEIAIERLRREYQVELVTTAPSVAYKIDLQNGTTINLRSPADYPDPTHILASLEPWIKATIILPREVIGPVIQLCTELRGKQISLEALEERAVLVYELPLNEVVFDFHDRLKSLSRGYASFDYEPVGFREGNLVKLSILINGEAVDALSCILHRERAAMRAKSMCAKLKTLIPQQLFKVAIQGAIGGTIIARETVGALRKDVTAKCYGGDITRKRKLLEKQKKGKKRMRQIGKVNIPNSAFIAALKTDMS